MKNKLILVFLWMSICFSSNLFAADAVSFTADAPRTVVIGQNFNLVYSANVETRDLRIAEFNEFDILSGPFTSTMSSSTYVNGQYSSSTTYRFTYVLNAKKIGTFTIPSATAIVKGSRRTSNSLTIKVFPQDKQNRSNNNASSQASRGVGSSSSSSQNISSDQMFIRVVPSKSRVHEQEGLTVTYKVYTRVDIVGFENPKFPEFKGFMAQEVDVPQNQQWNLENYNGNNYRVATLKQTILYPQKSGTLIINKGTFDVTMRVRNQNNNRTKSIFDDFFETYSDVKKTVASNSIKIEVDPLPAGKPKNFCGVAGSLGMTSSITGTNVKANDAVTIRLKISGSGNLKMIPTPNFTFPPDFEVYDPKVNNAFKNTSHGVTGTKTIEYLFIPRYAGTFKIPAVSISYYDLSSRSYKTLTSDSYTLNVAKGSDSGGTVSGNFSDQEQVRMLNSDIRYLKTDIKPHKNLMLIYGQYWFWLCFILPFLFFTIFLIVNRKQVKANADISRVRNRKANKVAVKRLKQAGVFLKAGKKEAFYDEVLKALWGYTSDKLSIPLSRLSKETIESQLDDFQVNQDIKKEYMDILETCEYARFAPGDEGHAMDELYQKTMDVMNKMENTIKK